MRGVLSAAVVLWLCAGGTAVARGGGGVHYITVPIFVRIPGVRGPFHPDDVIEIPMEITDAPVSHAEGQIGKGEVIAIHTVRALDAVVLLEPAQGRGGDIPAGRILTQVVVHHGQDRKPVYCDLNIAAGRRSLYKWDCFSDSQNAGRLDTFWDGKSGDAFMGFWTDPYEMNRKWTLSKTAAYRKANLEERPTGEVGYRWCGRDAASGAPRFSVAGHWSNDYFESAEADACGFGVRTDAADPDRVRIDRITATIRPGSATNTLAVKVEGRIEPGPIAHFHPNGGIVAAESAEVETAQEMEELKRPPFLAAGLAPTSVLGVVGRGREFYAIPVRHSITGVLTNEVRTGTYALLVGAAARPRPGLEPGQIMYAARVGGAIESQLVWCAPIRAAGGTWSNAVCLPSNGVGNLYIEAQPPMMGAAHLTIPVLSPPYAAAPIVVRKPVDLPTMRLSYAFAGWNKGALQVEISLDSGDGVHALQTRSWSADQAGDVHVPVVGGEILVRRTAGDDGSVTVGTFTPQSQGAEPVDP